MSEKEELKQRVEAKRKALEAELLSFRADLTGAKKEKVDKVENQLKTLQKALKNGWDRLSENAARTLNKWLKDV